MTFSKDGVFPAFDAGVFAGIAIAPFSSLALEA
jgi:hypothetical protein